MKRMEREIIRWGKLLFERRLISGWGGNISCRIDKERVLITGQHAPLGFLTSKDLIEIDLQGRPINKKRQPSSETPLHLAIYRGTEAKAVIHAHPPLVLAFSLGHESFVPLSFEEKYTIGEVPILSQETPTVTQTGPVVKELGLRPIVILRGHGTVAAGKELEETFLVTDLLEEAVRCQLFHSENTARKLPDLERRQKAENSKEKNNGYMPFSREHMAALTRIANNDPEFQNEGKEARLTTTLTLHLQEEEIAWTVHFEKGRITRLEEGIGGEFLISGTRELWEAVFQSRIDPFLATQQGKLKLKQGELWKLSQWFKPFQRAFRLWQTVPIRMSA